MHSLGTSSICRVWAWLGACLLFAALGPTAWAQGEETEAPPEAAPDPDESPEPTPEPVAEPAPAAADAEIEPPVLVPASTLTVHLVTSRNTYSEMAFDVFDVATQQVVASGEGADESAGEAAPRFELPAGVYKIVPSGEPFNNRRDFATVRVDGPTNFVIVIDSGTGHFRGAGLVTGGELPTGRKLAGIRLSLNVGGNLVFDQQSRVIGTTNGTSTVVGLFGNFSMVFDRGPHFLKVDSRLNVNVMDPRYASAFSTTDFFEGSALYAFNIKNPWVGPYARAGFRTKVYPGYLYLENDGPSGVVNVNRLDGSVDSYAFGSQSNVDDLRIEVAKAFAPLVLQQEIGANLKAVDIDLRLFELSVATRLGFGFREGISNGLLVVDGQEDGGVVNLFEVDDYWTLGPVAGASATVTFARWLFGSAEAGVMVPVRDTDRAGSDFADRLLIDLSGTGGFKFPALSFFYASVDYTLRLQRDGYLTSNTQFAHSIMARANLQIF